MHVQRLASPLTIKALTFANRVVMPPLVIWSSDESGLVTDAHVAHYTRSAGPGLMIVEATTIDPAGRLAATQLGIWEDRQVDGLARLARAIHESGSLAGIQIHHAGGNTNKRNTYGLSPLVPSLVERSPEGASELTVDQIDALLDRFACATTRALAAGFDVIELHGAHGYLISQFLSPELNRRSDRWGGDPEARRSFLAAAIRRSRDEIQRAGRANDVALTVRLGIAASGERALPIDEGLAAARAAVEAGVDFLDISNAGGIDDALGAEIRRRATDLVAATDRELIAELTPTALLALLVRTELGASHMSVPVVSVDGYSDPKKAERALAAHVADLIAVGRGTLADPGWTRKTLGIDDRPLEPCQACKPRCFWFREPTSCPARRRLAKRGEQPAVADSYAFAKE